MIIIAFGLGLIISVPLGPLGQMMLNRVIYRGFWHGFSIAILSAIADFIVCEFFLVGTVSVGSLNPWIKIGLQIAGLLFLAYIGVKEIILPLVGAQKYKATESTKKAAEKLRFDEKMMLKNIATVISYYVSNPTYLAFWLSFSVLINQKFIVIHDLLHFTLFSFFFAAGTLTCQYVAISLVKKAAKTSVKREILKYISIPLYSATIVYFFYLITRNLLHVLV